MVTSQDCHRWQSCEVVSVYEREIGPASHQVKISVIPHIARLGEGEQIHLALKVLALANFTIEDRGCWNTEYLKISDLKLLGLKTLKIAKS